MSKLPRGIYTCLYLALFLGLFFNSYNKDEFLFTIVAILEALRVFLIELGRYQFWLLKEYDMIIGHRKKK